MRQTNANANAPRPTPVTNFLKYHGSDRVKTDTWNTSTLLSHKHEYNKLRQTVHICSYSVLPYICSLPFTVLGVR